MENNDLLKEMIKWRHYLHQIPETAFEEVETAKFVSEKLKEMGYEVVTGERVIIVTGCINALAVRVSETFIENKSCIA